MAKGFGGDLREKDGKFDAGRHILHVDSNRVKVIGCGILENGYQPTRIRKQLLDAGRKQRKLHDQGWRHRWKHLDRWSYLARVPKCGNAQRRRCLRKTGRTCTPAARRLCCGVRLRRVYITITGSKQQTQQHDDQQSDHRPGGQRKGSACIVGTTLAVVLASALATILTPATTLAIVL